mmetsp:Transcript_29224/g.64676  ORF Transcript_29224/g.64676 Transcript_29224/m.64676 type:complete len:200 (+) Transcript_29224:793-1392(+)
MAVRARTSHVSDVQWPGSTRQYEDGIRSWLLSYAGVGKGCGSCHDGGAGGAGGQLPLTAAGLEAAAGDLGLASLAYTSVSHLHWALWGLIQAKLVQEEGAGLPRTCHDPHGRVLANHMLCAGQKATRRDRGSNKGLMLQHNYQRIPQCIAVAVAACCARMDSECAGLCELEGKTYRKAPRSGPSRNTAATAFLQVTQGL